MTSLWSRLSKSLGFIPGLIVLIFAALGIALVELDKSLDLDGVAWVFAGDGPAARTVLSVIAGSLITVAGLTFSITMVVLQLASSQFSPRILRTFFADRITQVTIGTYIGTFVYSILVLRAVGSFADAGFVPRLSVSIAALLGIAAVVLLIVYLHHVSRMVQVSQVTADIAADTLARIDALMPEPYAPPAADPQPDDPANAPAQIHARRAGYVQYVSLGDGISDQASRVAILVCPGDFVGLEAPIAEVTPAAAADACEHGLLAAVTIAAERDLDQDVDFGIRQLTDIALRAVSPGVNDPMTAVTCISYLRSILVRLTERAPPIRLLRGSGPQVRMRQREYDEYLDAVLQLSRHAAGDAWVAGELLLTLHACARAAVRHGAGERAQMLHGIASTVAEQASREAGNQRDRDRIAALMDQLDRDAAPRSR